jgi:hypothetical protein
MFKGEKVVEQYGAPPRSTSVTRRVYAPDGTLMYDTTWSSYYMGEPTIVRLGTKTRPAPADPKADAKGDKKPAGPGAGAEDAPAPPTVPAPTTRRS